MKVSIEINDGLLEEALEVANVDSIDQLINLALSEFVIQRRRKNIKELAGKIEFSKGYDYKSMR